MTPTRGSSSEPSPGTSFASPSPALRSPLVELDCSSTSVTVAVPLHGFRGPSTPFPFGPEVFPASVRASSLYWSRFRPRASSSPSESDRSWFAAVSPAATLLGFGPLQRFRNWKPGLLGFASPDTFRLQGFAPSCRFPSSSPSSRFQTGSALGVLPSGPFPCTEPSSLSESVTFLTLSSTNPA